jgi:D-inositol-3-phosphate glycosyltransferase
MAILSIHSSPLGRAGARDTGGMSTYLRGLAGALGQTGHRVDLLTRAIAPNSEEIREVSPNVRLIQLDDYLGPLTKEEIYPHCPAIAESIDVFRIKSGITYKVIFSHYWLSGCVGRVLQQRWKVPHLIMFHTLGRAKNEACSAENEPRLRLEEEEKLAVETDRIIVAAEQEKDKILGYYDLPADRVGVISSGIDRGLFRTLDRAKAKDQLGFGQEKIILFVGRIEPVKGLDLLIRAVAKLPAEDNYRLLIVGGDDHSEALVAQLKEIAAETGIAGKITFQGLVEHEQLPLYYNAADVTAVTSHYESFGLTALESIACGTPVIAGPVGIIPELITPADEGCFGYLINDRSPESWAARIHQALSRAEAIRAEEIAGKLAPFSWNEAAARLAGYVL